MPIILRHNEQLEISRVEYFGQVRGSEIRAHAAFNVANQVWLGFDCISVVHADIDVSALSMDDLDKVFAANQQLFEPLQLLFMRRSGWVCQNPVAQRFLSHWLSMRNAEKLPFTDVRQFGSFEAAGEWLLLSPQAIATLRKGDGFKEVARFDDTPARGR